MTTLTFALRDSNTMLRRNLRHMLRYPSLTFMLAGLPIIFMLLFVFVFGATLGAGLGGDRGDYLTFVVPGVLLLTIGSATTGTAISVASDMTEGIVARFRTMAIARVSILTGHVLGSLIQTFVVLSLVLGVAVAIGYRPTANPAAWLGVAAVLGMVSFALTWLAVALGLVAKTVEEASNTPMPLTLLPFLGSGFVPTDTMPAGLRQFAEFQPFTPFMETVRALLAGTSPGGHLITTVAWCAGIALTGYLWARHRYNKL
ncbi:ABC transporter permease [Actinoplanes sp. NPDC051494]|uniref:ABC transporter permease n=1 Tax=Actinoplanes sp. NPDC051494 TaxID=3363907 RepID=UPI003790B09E